MRTAVTVVPNDQMISVDGLVYVFKFSAPENLHAIQWSVDSGHCEFNDGTANRELRERDYDETVLPYVRLWEAENRRVEQERAEEEIESNKLPNVKKRMLSELTFSLNEVRETAWVKSSLGFKADANDVANTNVEGLIKSLTALDESSTIFCDYDNEEHLVTVDDLRVLQLEIILNGQNLYRQKWAIRDAIKAASRRETLDAIKINFTMMDFSK